MIRTGRPGTPRPGRLPRLGLAPRPVRVCRVSQTRVLPNAVWGQTDPAQASPSTARRSRRPPDSGKGQLAGAHQPTAAAAGRTAAARRGHRHEPKGDARTLPSSGLPLWPGASRLVIPLPARPLRLARRRSQPPSRVPLARWLLASLYTLRPHLGGEMPSKPSSVPKFVLGHSLTM